MSRDKSGRTLEDVVGRILQMFDPKSSVTRREKIVNRLGIEREFDVVIRGKFAGQPVLVVIECKDWSDRVGTPEIDAFITKTRDINAHLKFIVSSKGFTEPALAQAKDAGVGTFSLLLDDPNTVGFDKGVFWYARSYTWERQAQIHFAGKAPRPGSYSANQAFYGNAPILNVFDKELSTTYVNTKESVPITLRAVFHPNAQVVIGGETFLVSEIKVRAERHMATKRRFMPITGDGLYNWQTKCPDVPETGSVRIHGFNPNLPDWEDYSGDIPETGPYQLVVDRYWGSINLEVEKIPDIPGLNIECILG